jgi:hypothetical protein
MYLISIELIEHKIFLGNWGHRSRTPIFSVADGGGYAAPVASIGGHNHQAGLP